MGKRIAWIDIARGIGIILVVYGHALSAGPLRSVIYSFHMPLFFFLSGVVYRSKPEDRFLSFVKKNARNILLPYFLFAVLSFLLWVISKHPSPEQMTLQFGSIFYGNGNQGLLAFNNLLWFLPCLFITRVGLYPITHKLHGKREICIALFIFSLIGYFCGVYFPNLKLPFGLETALTAIVFVGGGYLWYSSQNYLANHFRIIVSVMKSRLSVLALSSLMLTCCVGVALLSYHLFGLQVDMRQDKYHSYLLFYPAAFLGIGATLLLSQAIGYNKLLEYLGKQSLVIFAWHLQAFPYVSKLLFYTHGKPLLKALPLFISPIVYSMLSIVIVLMLSVPIQKLIRYAQLRAKS